MQSLLVGFLFFLIADGLHHENRSHQSTLGKQQHFSVDADWVTDYQNKFDFLDADGDGLVGFQEFRKILVSKDSTITKDQVNQIISSMDADGNEKIDFPQFLTISAPELRQIQKVIDLKEGLKQYFDKHSEDGLMSKSAFRESLQKEAALKLTDQQFDQLMQKADSNGDEALNKKEFVKVLMEMVIG